MLIIYATTRNWITLKSNDYPIYYEANVTDDHLMNISDVLRGWEWQTSRWKDLILHKMS